MAACSTIQLQTKMDFLHCEGCISSTASLKFTGKSEINGKFETR